MTLLSSTSHILLDIPLDAEPMSSTQSWQVRLNQLCLQGLAPWLADEFGVAAAQVEAAVGTHTTIWPLVNGSAVPIDDATRLILIPSTAIDQSELRVPQEWVDIPNWVGDYYAAVRINPDSNQLCVWGFTTHAKLKQTARYDADDRSYCLDSEEVTDLAVLLTARALGLAEATQANVAALPELPAAQVDSLVQRLTNRLMPRLTVPFALWGALLADERLRSRLIPSATQTTNLSQWLSRLTQTGSTFTQGWQTLASLLPESEMALAFRSNEPLVRRGKRLTLGTAPDAITMILLMAVATAADQQMSMQVQLRPEPKMELPEDLELSLLSPSGDSVQQVRRQSLDSYIQLKRFRLPPGYGFTIQVRSGSQTVQEPFMT
ncbi:DUF1822 family protein [Leptolyngbya cf. ectocarpi LEGE 11479]|uniref:DUF1822 family protein n=1 Tax=Leptolyngbya cf. ectocarpi LEGE 11479 TaxID=1828722 RepID=A0A928ZX78_LEPEC|nr:DUF1822 family protein [Leptolyngbya ectocarpi]MBE9069060.1 DUF1822 family protein [Leptolyngbya cf. ectocarpi LEGE 11479]